ncbi:hypothetical protein [Yersinia bercovieri]|nr:hypothetical protein [Yersinia bercovieri]
MSWYRTGKITAASGQNVITGTGTQWANNVMGVAPGQALIVPRPDGNTLIYEILAVDSDTKIRINGNIVDALTSSDYGIQTSVSNSYSALARETSAQLGLYQQLLKDWQLITTGTGDVTIIAPDGSEVIIPSLSDLTAWVNDSKTWFNDNRELIENAGEVVAGAETARDQAVAANATAQAAKTTAVNSAATASTAATTATGAAATATTASGTAVTAKNDAVTARDVAVAAAASVNLEPLGIGLPNQPDIQNFDWQNFSFTSGANYVTRYDTWVNPPEGVTYNAGTRVSIRVIYISTVNGPRMRLELTSDTGVAANFKVYSLLCVGESGSRVFTFNQDWNSANPVPISGGGTGAITAPLARTALGLGSAAVVDVVANSADQTAGRAMTTGSNGIGGQALNMTSVGNAWLNPLGMMSFTTATNWGGTTPTDGTGSLPAHWNVISIGVGTGQPAAASRKAVIAIQSYNVGSGAPQCYVRTIHDTTLSPAVMLYHTNNTTVDSNGFLKKASPVVKLYGDGSSETNYESEGAISERISEGVYKISGVLGFNSDDSWGGVDGGIEIPIDKNKQPLIWVDYEIDEGGDLIIKTYHRTHPTSPVFAQNNINGYENGQPIDIPAGRFVDLRIQMPEREETELPLTEE